MEPGRYLYFMLAALNSFGTTLFFYYFYFLTRHQFGFDDRQNLWLAALQGGVYAIGSWFCGRAAERWGYRASLTTGFVILGAVFAWGAACKTLWVHLILLGAATLGVCFTWPALEALVSEGQDREGIQRSVGLYNLVWASTGAVAYFLGGTLLEQWGLRALYLMPLAFVLVQLALLVGAMVSESNRCLRAKPALGNAERNLPGDESRTLLRMAWMANPFAYMAIQTLVAVMPGIAARLDLTTAWAGVWGSVWCFGRLGAFAVCWHWDGWHYRAAWLLGAFAVMTAFFLVILLAPSVPWLVLGQVFFGAAVGLIYYSSLFYSMDASSAKAAHGGIHEAAIGLGNMSGPLIGAVALQLAPGRPLSSALAVTLLLGMGGAALMRMWHRCCSPRHGATGAGSTSAPQRPRDRNP